MKLVTFCLIVNFAFTRQSAPDEFSELVELPTGKILGTVEKWQGKKAYEYKGIPFAAPPTGKLRFVKPQDPLPWEGLKYVTEFGKSCPQATWLTKSSDQSEDCLFLNVYVNQEIFAGREEQLKPVLFWIHGGAFTLGSGSDRDGYRGVPLVLLHDVVLVTINYRLGVLGFSNSDELPSLAPNLGLWDQNKALQWVQKNIHLFGGDPNRVTIYGQSSGSNSVASHILSPQSEGLFQGAIMESGGIFPLKENGTQRFGQLIESVGCSNALDKLDCLRAVSVSTLRSNNKQVNYENVFGDEFLPLTAEEAMAGGQFNDVNLMIGAERDEGDGLTCGTYQFAAQKASKSTKPTYGYFHTQEAKQSWVRYLTNWLIALYFRCGRTYGKVCHCDELVYTFGVPVLKPGSYDKDDIELSQNMMKIWADFAANGKPSDQGSVEWPPFKDPASDKLRVIELNNHFIGKIDESVATRCLSI